MVDRLSGYPYVELNLKCNFCSRAGTYRIVRLAAKYGAETLLRYLAGDCEYWRPAHPYRNGCGAHFSDLEPPTRPPDLPVRCGGQSSLLEARTNAADTERPNPGL